MAIFMTSVVIAIASISNDNLQDLKTGQLVGATPWRQQIALLLGSVAGAIAICSQFLTCYTKHMVSQVRCLVLKWIQMQHYLLHKQH